MSFVAPLITSLATSLISQGISSAMGSMVAGGSKPSMGAMPGQMVSQAPQQGSEVSGQGTAPSKGAAETAAMRPVTPGEQIAGGQPVGGGVQAGGTSISPTPGFITPGVKDLLEE